MTDAPKGRNEKQITHETLCTYALQYATCVKRIIDDGEKKHLVNLIQAFKTIIAVIADECRPNVSLVVNNWDYSTFEATVNLPLETTVKPNLKRLFFLVWKL